MWSQSLGMVTQYGSIHKCPRSVPTPPSLWHGTLRVIHGSHSPWRCRATKPFQRIVHPVPLPRWVGLVGLGWSAWTGLDWVMMTLGVGRSRHCRHTCFVRNGPPRAVTLFAPSLSWVQSHSTHTTKLFTNQPTNHSSHTHKKNQTNDDQQLGRFPTP